MQQRTKSRLFAGSGFAWITVIVSVLVFLYERAHGDDAGLVEYGAIGIIAMVGIWRGASLHAHCEHRLPVRLDGEGVFAEAP